MCEEFCGTDETWEDSIENEIARLDGAQSALIQDHVASRMAQWELSQRLDILADVVRHLVDHTTDTTAHASLRAILQTAHTAMGTGARAPETSNRRNTNG